MLLSFVSVEVYGLGSSSETELADAGQTDRAYILEVIAGGQEVGYVDGSAKEARFSQDISGLGMGPDGVLYVADNGNRAIRKILPNGEVRSVASFYRGNGSGNGVAFDSQGNCYFLHHDE